MSRRKRDILAYEKRRESGLFFPFPSAVLKSEAFCRLSPYAVKLLVDLLAQFNGSVPNNGDFSSTWALMKPRGWRSKATLAKALRELDDAGFIIKTRAGGKHKCSLWAVTFLAIDRCGGKLDVNPTATPTGGWDQDGKLRLPPPELRPKIRPKFISPAPLSGSKSG